MILCEYEFQTVWGFWINTEYSILNMIINSFPGMKGNTSELSGLLRCYREEM